MQYKQTSQRSKPLGYILAKMETLAYTLVLNCGGRTLAAVGQGTDRVLGLSVDAAG